MDLYVCAEAVTMLRYCWICIAVGSYTVDGDCFDVDKADCGQYREHALLPDFVVDGDGRGGRSVEHRMQA